VEQNIDRAMNWYGVHVLERLEVETRMLKRLTKVLIGLTIGLVCLTGVLTVLTSLLVSGIKLPW